ncbi:hypothetical protein MRB53_011517 [Persea americana]|uniref:Uncharacterized protein n=1 Tax=Persea americana TaxID=3435 RepID=A0ACC2LV53_PERAE|nr:hypothetical protein MRB53_011517 [Persea americana]
MGNCQAADAAMVVIQHPGGRVERSYWPLSASEVMRSNPGHYVALVTLCQPSEEEKRNNGGIRFTRVKLLRAKDTLVLGQVYRLLTSEEVMKGLWAKKHARMKKNPLDSERKKQIESGAAQTLDCGSDARKTESGNLNQDVKQERNRQKATQTTVKPSKQWRPSLQSISEVGS